jgi:hypothetical protein
MSRSVEEEERKKEQIIADEASRVAAIHARRQYMAKLRGENPPYFRSSSIVEQDKEEDRDKDKDNKRQRKEKKKAR